MNRKHIPFSTSVVHDALNDETDRRVMWHSEIEYWGKYWENNWGCAARGMPCDKCGVCGDDIGLVPPMS